MNTQQASMIFSLANGSVLFTEGHIYSINNNLDLCDFDIKNQKMKIISMISFISSNPLIKIFIILKQKIKEFIVLMVIKK